MKYKHSRYYYAKKYAENRLKREEMSREDCALLAHKPSTDKEIIAKIRAMEPRFGVVELTRTAECVELMMSRNRRVSDGALGLFIPSVAMDLADAMVRDVKRIKNLVTRKKAKLELQQKIANFRYQEQSDRINARRRELAAERRKIKRRTTTAAMPTPFQIRKAWLKRKSSHDAMIHLGGLIQTLECYVDNCLKVGENGKILGRRGGIRSWIKACVPELALHYKTLMRYKAMVKKLRQATRTKDPTPTEELIKTSTPSEVIFEIRALPKNTFSSLISYLDAFPKREEEKLLAKVLEEERARNAEEEKRKEAKKLRLKKFLRI